MYAGWKKAADCGWIMYRFSWVGDGSDSRGIGVGWFQVSQKGTRECDQGAAQ